MEKSHERDSALDNLWNCTNGSMVSMKKLLEGRILTLMDAVAVDDTQRKALKSMARQFVWSEESWTAELRERFRKFAKENDMELKSDSPLPGR